LDGNGTAIRTITSTFDAASQLTSISDPSSRYSYQYDAAGQLLRVDNLGTPNAPNVVLDYTYDLVGNRVRVSDTINGVQRGQEQFSYDALNRLITTTQSGTGIASKRVDMTYNAAS
jgi:YD repeat-containing protein